MSPKLLLTAVVLVTLVTVVNHPHVTAQSVEPGTLLYEADWSSGVGEWAGGRDWKVLNGTLLNDGTDSDGEVRAPYRPGDWGIADYAVEAEIQVQKGLGGDNYFGFRVRRDSNEGWYACYVAEGWGAYCYAVDRRRGDKEVLRSERFTPGEEWHTYRVEVQGNSIKFFIDGRQWLATTDNRFLFGGEVSLRCGGVQLAVRSFRIIAL